MVDRIFREYVFTLQTAGAGEDVHDISGIMQDIAPRKGFKLHRALWYTSTGAAAATDLSEVYLNMLKNISEAAHHLDPGADGEITDVRVGGVIFSDFLKFQNGIQLMGPLVHDFYAKPIIFDKDDRMNLEATFNNLDAAAADAIIRLFLDVEV